MTTFTPELTTRLRELLAKATKGPMRASVTDKVRVLTSDGLFLADFGHDLNGAADDARLYIESKLALPTLLDHIEAQDRRIAELRSALGRIAFEDQPSYLSCPSTPFCSPGRSHDEFCGVGIAQAALEGQL